MIEEVRCIGEVGKPLTGDPVPVAAAGMVSRAKSVGVPMLEVVFHVIWKVELHEEELANITGHEGA